MVGCCAFGCTNRGTKKTPEIAFDRIMKSHIAGVLKQALNTFTCKPETFQTNLEILKTELKTTTSKDVNLNPDFLNENFWKIPNKAPVTYIDIYEDKNLTMGIFVLKPHMKLPLHNHPQMHGLIKVISGKVKVTSYSVNTPKTQQADKTILSESMTNKRIVTAELCPEIILDADSDCCLLQPDDKNLHEIETVDGPAAFIDILSPPYESCIANNGIRHCTYYEVKHEVLPGIFRLQEIRAPSWYWTDSYHYDGPDL